MTAAIGELLAPYLTEREMQDAIRMAALRNGWLFYHTHNSRRSDEGFPDCVCVKGERIVFFELKAQKGKVSPKQRRWVEDLRRAANNNVTVAIVRPIPREGEMSYDDALALLSEELG